MNAYTKDEIQKKIGQITDSILHQADSISTPGLYGGKSGVGIYFSYLNKYQPHPKFNSIISKLITDAFESINDEVFLPTYSFGVSGILWAIHHLKSNGLIDADDYFEEIIPVMGDQMLLYAKHENFDYLHGALGIGFYLLHFRNAQTDAYLHKLIKLLKQKGISDDQTIKWESNFNSEGQKNFNLSLSHGLSGIIIFLSKLYQQKSSYAYETQEILNKSLNYLVSQKNSPDENLISLFPNSGESPASSKNSRLSWCYGDLGIASAFWQAGKALQEEKWKKEAIGIMQHAARRRNLVSNDVADAGICHGTAGIAHVFNRFYWETKYPVFKEAAGYWIEETLKMANFEDGLAGYKAWQGEQGWINQHGILEGVAGIGLVLMSHVYQEEPCWDSSFLLS